MGQWKDAAHLIRLILLLGVGVAAFLVIRGAVVPAGFGQYGHFRAGALDDVREKAIVFAGRNACESCHAEQVAAKQKGKHAMMSCEACHGPQAKHADDPSEKPKRPEVSALCVRCHEASSARPKSFPQVIAKEHAGGEACNSCHKPHTPKFGA
jgi:hypothetical protein